MPQHVALTEAVKNYIAGQTYSQAVEVSRANLPEENYKGLDKDTYYCVVFPGPRTTQLIGGPRTKATFERRYTVFVAVFTRVEGIDPSLRRAREDNLISLGEEIENSLLLPDQNGMRRLEDPDVTAPPFLPEIADGHGVFNQVFPALYYMQYCPEAPSTETCSYLRDASGNYLRDAAGNYFKTCSETGGIIATKFLRDDAGNYMRDANNRFFVVRSA